MLMLIYIVHSEKLNQRSVEKMTWKLGVAVAQFIGPSSMNHRIQVQNPIADVVDGSG